jgi:hypothetical protein
VDEPRRKKLGFVAVYVVAVCTFYSLDAAMWILAQRGRCPRGRKGEGNTQAKGNAKYGEKSCV